MNEKETLIFTRKGWTFWLVGKQYWLEYHRVLYYGDTQGVSIYGPGEVAYDWPELVPAYIKRRITAYSYRAAETEARVLLSGEGEAAMIRALPGMYEMSLPRAEMARFIKFLAAAALDAPFGGGAEGFSALGMYRSIAVSLGVELV
jgi:hypothetical protein